MYLEKNFTISKGTMLFTSIGSNHALEQENKVMKATGGVKGLTKNPSGLQRFCFTAPILNAISKEFCSKCNIATKSRIRHYQLTGSTNSRISNNVNKLMNMYDTFDVSFQPSDAVINIISKAVLPTDIARKSLQHSKIDHELYFIDEPLVGSESLWSRLKKCNLPTFRNQRKKISMTIEKKVVLLKEERTLLSRTIS